MKKQYYNFTVFASGFQLLTGTCRAGGKKFNVHEEGSGECRVRSRELNDRYSS
jgi:hypothetical protein